MRFLLALQFLTRLPVKWSGNVEITDMARSMSYFPVVGLFIGVMAAAVHALLSLFLGGYIPDIITLVFLIFITGNIHLDGLMDSADGLFSGKPGEKMLEIMRDSRVGAHGVTACCLVLLLKLLLLGEVAPGQTAVALVLMPLLGRWTQVYGARFYSYARAGKGTGDFTRHVGNRELFWASLVAVLVPVLLLGAGSMFLLGPVLAGTVLAGYYIRSKIGGMTGDTLGAVTECIEVLVLFVMQFFQPGNIELLRVLDLYF